VRILTQNIQWGGDPKAPGCDGEPRLARLVTSLSKLDADLLVLTEFKSGEFADELKMHLREAGYPHFKSHVQAPYKLGTAIASRRPVYAIELPLPATSDAWRSIGLSVDGIDVFGFYFPLNEAKAQYWDWLIANTERLRDRNVVLAGDFNTGRIRIDEAGETFDCQDKHEELERLGFVDTWRASYPKGRDYTWYSSSGNGFRLDYIWVSPSLAPHVQRVWHYHETRLTLSSDHSAVAVELSNSTHK
jgi:exodeoxyribonuclease-3